MFYVYILYSEKTDRYYVGQTEDLKSRSARHNNNQVPSTKNKGPWKIVYSEKFLTRVESVNREKQIKQMKSRKYIVNLMNNQTGNTRPDL